MSLLTNLKAWYKLDEAAGNPRLDSSGNGPTLSEAGGGTVLSAAGVIGNAASFAGDGHLLTNTSVNIFGAGSTAGSFSCWIKPSDPGTYGWMGATFASALRVGIHTTGGNVLWTAHSAYVLSATISSGVWSHVVGTFDGTTERLYVNGVLQGTNAATGTLAVTRFSLGAQAQGLEPALGLLDLVGVWNRALTDGGVSVGQTAGGEIAQLYNGGAGLDYPSFAGVSFLQFGNDAVYVPGGSAGQEASVGGKRGQVFIEGGTAGGVSI